MINAILFTKQLKVVIWNNPSGPLLKLLTLKSFPFWTSLASFWKDLKALLLEDKKDQKDLDVEVQVVWR